MRDLAFTSSSSSTKGHKDNKDSKLRTLKELLKSYLLMQDDLSYKLETTQRNPFKMYLKLKENLPDSRVTKFARVTARGEEVVVAT